MSNKDFARLRELAKQVREIAELPVQRTNKELWQAINDRKMIHPAVFVRDYPIYMVNYNNELTPTIENKFLRELEADLLLKIYEWKHLRCNRVIEPVIKCNVVATDTRFGFEAAVRDLHDVLYGEEINTAKHFERQITCVDDLERIKYSVVKYDEETTMKNFNMMKDIFDGILDVKLYGIDYFHFVPWDDLLSWMGIEEGMYDFVLNPELMHKAAERYVDVCVDRAKQYEKLGLISSNNTNMKVGQGGPGYTSALPTPTESGIGARLCDNWGDGADQILTSVSPAMTKEFAFDYECKWAEMFGLFSYGCCERLDHKVNELKTFKNLRKLSVSPFANLEAAMEKLGGDVVVSFKPNSNYLTDPVWNRELSKNELIRVCDLAHKYNSNVEIIMKTLITLRGEPQRLWEWCDMALDIVKNY